MKEKIKNVLAFGFLGLLIGGLLIFGFASNWQVTLVLIGTGVVVLLFFLSGIQVMEYFMKKEDDK